jgi:hypothetical protein
LDLGLAEQTLRLVDQFLTSLEIEVDLRSEGWPFLDLESAANQRLEAIHDRLLCRVMRLPLQLALELPGVELNRDHGLAGWWERIAAVTVFVTDAAVRAVDDDLDSIATCRRAGVTDGFALSGSGARDSFRAFPPPRPSVPVGNYMDVFGHGSRWCPAESLTL